MTPNFRGGIERVKNAPQFLTTFLSTYKKLKFVKSFKKNSYLKSFLLLTIMGGVFAFPDLINAYGNGFTYSRSITIDHTKVPNTDQTDFPVLVSGTYSYLATVANGGNVQNASGYDVGFYTNSDCSTGKMAWETETYTATTGAVNYWVKVPTVATASDTVFYMCYGNSSITTDQSSATSVWDSNFKGVWHLPNGTMLNALDSTGVNNGTITGAMATTGKIDGGANNFATNSRYINVGSTFGGTINTVTVSVWIYATSLTPFQGIFLDNNEATRRGLVTSGASGYPLAYMWQNTEDEYSAASGLTISLNTWHYATMVITPTAATLYLDGSSWTNTKIHPTKDMNRTWTIGDEGLHSAWAGSLDEARISSIARSADWISTEYNNQNSPSTFYTVGAESSDTTAPVFSSVTPATSASINNVTGSSDISFTTDEALASGSITITRTGGTADASSPHTCTLTGTALNVGAHTIDLSDTTNGCASDVSDLVSGAEYTFVLAGQDASGNTATSVTNTGVTFSQTFNFCKAVTIDHTKVPNTDQTNFPVLISGTYDGTGGEPDLRTTGNGGDVENASGYDVGFYTSSDCGAGKMAWETETYSATTGAVNYWVKVPTVATASDTVFYMAYGSTDITSDQSRATSVWDSNFKGVWHLGDSASPALDSTSNNNDGTQSGGVTFGATGQVDGATSFDGTDDYVNFGSGSSLAISGPITLSSWVNFGESIADEPIIHRWTSNTGYTLQAYQGKATCVINGGVAQGTTVLSQSTWYQIGCKWDGSTIRIYVNGTQEATASQTTLGDAGVNARLMKRSDTFSSNDEDYTWGSADEVRISSTARSADWIATEYNNQNSPSTFYTIQSSDITSPTAVITYSDADGIVKAGDTLTITATFSEALLDSPVVKIALSGSNTLSATAMTKTSATVYTYSHTVGAGDGTATVALSVGTDTAGNVVTSAPTSGATFTVDNTAPTISYSGATPADASTQSGTSADVTTTSDDSGAEHSVTNNFDSSLVSWWRGEGDATDYIGSNNGTANGGVTYTSGKYGQAMTFDGVDDYVSVADNNSLDLTSSGTLSVWTKASTNADQVIISKGANQFDCAYWEYGMWFYSNGSVGACAGRNSTYLATDGDIGSTSWHHIVYVWTSSSDSLYVDGLSVKTGSGGGPDGSSEILSIGARGDGTINFNGSIDNVQIYNRALSAGEISSLYNAESTEYTNTFSSLASGSHTFTSYAEDLAGNITSTTERSFTVDNTAPAVSITAPADSATVSGDSVSVTANASDGVGVVGVQFKLDGVNLGGEDTTSTYGVTWDTTTASEGSHTLTAVARDATGNSTTSGSITVTVNNIVIPTITTSPSTGLTGTEATLNGSIDTLGGENATARGFEWGRTTDYSATTTESGSHSAGDFTASLSSLTCATEYHFRGYAVNSAGTGYGDDQTFTTSACPVVTQSSSSSGSRTGGSTVVTPPEPRAPEGGYTFFISPNPTTNTFVTFNFKGGQDITKIQIADNPSFSPATYIDYALSAGWIIANRLGEQTYYVKFCNQYAVCGETLSNKVIHRLPPVSKASTKKTFVEKLTDIIPDFLKPTPPVIETKLPVVGEAPPVSLTGEWTLVPNQTVNNFVLAPLPSDIAKLNAKFPELEKVFARLGIEKISDLEKLKNTDINLPTITDKKNVPSEILIADGGQGLITLGSSIALTSEGEVRQKIEMIVGKPIVLSIKPESPASSIKGHLLFKRRPEKTTMEIPTNSLVASAFFARASVAQISSDTPTIEYELLVHSFEYTDADGDGIFTAEISAPVVEGEYEVLTVINYKDKEKGSKELRMITVVDPEGYVYEKSAQGKEIRLDNIKVSIFSISGGVTSLWDAVKYSQDNPQITDNTGKYSFLVPPGKYYITAEAKGYKSYKSDEFDVKEGAGVHFNIEMMEDGSWFRALLDWKMIIIIIFGVALVVNFINDRRRSKINN